MLGEVLCKVISPKKPMDVKFPLVFTIFYPIYTHADGFRPALFHGAMYNTLGADVVNLQGCGWLEMAYLGEDGMDRGP